MYDEYEPVLRMLHEKTDMNHYVVSVGEGWVLTSSVPIAFIRGKECEMALVHIGSMEIVWYGKKDLTLLQSRTGRVR